MVERPSTRPVLLAGDRHLTGDEQPPPRLLGVDLVPGEEVRVIRQELLQEGLRVVRGLLHCDQLGIVVQKVDATSHLLTCMQKTLRWFVRNALSYRQREPTLKTSEPFGWRHPPSTLPQGISQG